MIQRRHFLSIAAAGAAAISMPAIRPARAAALSLRIGWQKNGVLALAKAQGALEKRLAPQGVEITWADFSSGPPLLEALGADALDFGPTGDVPPLFAQAAGGDLVYVGAYQGAASGSAILVSKDSKIQTLGDLRGKKVAFKRGSSAHNFIVKALRKAGLSPADIDAVDLPPPDAAAAFKTGSLDAWAIWDPYYAVAEQDPETRVLTSAEGIVDSWSFFLGNGAFAEANPQILLDVIDELKRGGVAAQANLDSTVPALAKITGVPEAVTRKTLTRPGFDLGKVFLLPEQAETYQQALADEFFNLGILPKKLAIRDIVWRPKASESLSGSY